MASMRRAPMDFTVPQSSAMIDTEMSRPMNGSAIEKPTRTPTRSEDDGQGREPVEARVHAVGDECRGADLLADADAVDRHGLVAAKPMSPAATSSHGARSARIDEAVDRLPASDDGGEGDDETR